MVGCGLTSLTCVEAHLMAHHVLRLQGCAKALRLVAMQLTWTSQGSCSLEASNIIGGA